MPTYSVISSKELNMNIYFDDSIYVLWRQLFHPPLSFKLPLQILSVYHLCLIQHGPLWVTESISLHPVHFPVQNVYAEGSLGHDALFLPVHILGFILANGPHPWCLGLVCTVYHRFVIM